jgi:hypothetical protein
METEAFILFISALLNISSISEIPIAEVTRLTICQKLPDLLVSRYLYTWDMKHQESVIRSKVPIKAQKQQPSTSCELHCQGADVLA